MPSQLKNHIAMFIITSLTNPLTQYQVSRYLTDYRENVRSQIYTFENCRRFFIERNRFADL